ncbi:hypothetical protein HanRHA438_Chr06g0277721 [Helianthus annuus]|nr:hypothetical protein HanIR_Chr06g0288801 [Helianthus annuus]KAJ0912739.1 hypothetical protein HanRHA438_Chr06g0277721 [Helianthus annuus]
MLTYFNLYTLSHAHIHTHNTIMYPDPYTTSTNYANHAHTKIIADAYGIILVTA